MSLSYACTYILGIEKNIIQHTFKLLSQYDVQKNSDTTKVAWNTFWRSAYQGRILIIITLFVLNWLWKMIKFHARFNLLGITLSKGTRPKCHWTKFSTWYGGICLNLTQQYWLNNTTIARKPVKCSSLWCACLVHHVFSRYLLLTLELNRFRRFSVPYVCEP